MQVPWLIWLGYLPEDTSVSQLKLDRMDDPDQQEHSLWHLEISDQQDLKIQVIWKFRLFTWNTSHLVLVQ